MKPTVAFLVALAPQSSLALIGINWSFSGAPSGGLKDVTYPFNMAGAPHSSGYYFAHQFGFENIPDVGYCGIQNRPDKNSESIVHAVFSSFHAGTATDDPNCQQGADGGPGVSCSVEFEGKYDSTYNITVENVSGTKWKGTAVNTETGNSIHIGSWTLPSQAGGMRNKQIGFVEYYPWSGFDNHRCSELPKTTVKMYDPTSKTSGAGQGRLDPPFEYGDCVGQVGFRVDRIQKGYKIQVGF